jgi:hypothetical protein
MRCHDYACAHGFDSKVNAVDAGRAVSDMGLTYAGQFPRRRFGSSRGGGQWGHAKNKETVVRSSMLWTTVLAIAISGACARPAPTATIFPFTAEETKQLFRLQWPNSSQFAGHGFLLDRGSQRPLGVTAYHVAGPIPGPIPVPQPIGTAVVTAALRHVVSPEIVIRLGERLPIAGARTISSGDTQHDVAAFEVVDWNPERALRLAAEPPSVGDTVFVLAIHYGSGGPDQHPLSGPRRHRALVRESTTTSFVFTYIGSANSNFTSGAAVLNQAGFVVGLNVGTNTPSGRVDGIGVGLTALRALLPP